MYYRFKIYFKDGTTDLSSGKGKRPTILYNDFDGLMDWDEFENLNENNITTQQELNLPLNYTKSYIKKNITE